MPLDTLNDLPGLHVDSSKGVHGVILGLDSVDLVLLDHHPLSLPLSLRLVHCSPSLVEGSLQLLVGRRVLHVLLVLVICRGYHHMVVSTNQVSELLLANVRRVISSPPFMDLLQLILETNRRLNVIVIVGIMVVLYSRVVPPRIEVHYGSSLGWVLDSIQVHPLLFLSGVSGFDLVRRLG